MRQTFLRPRLLLGENTVIISLSGRRVKRTATIPPAERGKGRSLWTRQAKALAPWAGVTYGLAYGAADCLEAPLAPPEALPLTEDIAYLL